MKSPYLDYDRIAPDYNQRYPSAQTWDRGQALLELAGRYRHGAFLEVGGGTGFWLNLLNQVTENLHLLDYSLGMLRQAKRQSAPLNLARGSAVRLPYRGKTFDLLYSVDAVHHFGDQRAFVNEAFRVLKPGGAFATIGHDPHEGTTNWYIYDHFDGVYDTDLRRYPAAGSFVDWMRGAGFDEVSSRTVEHIRSVHVGESVLRDPFLKKNATSQLALIGRETYDAGITRIRQALAESAARNETLVFSSDIQVKMLLGYKPG